MIKEVVLCPVARSTKFMIDQQLLNYVKQQLQQGVSREQIKNTLASIGWQASSVEEIFAVIGRESSVIPIDSGADEVNSRMRRFAVRFVLVVLVVANIFGIFAALNRGAYNAMIFHSSSVSLVEIAIIILRFVSLAAIGLMFFAKKRGFTIYTVAFILLLPFGEFDQLVFRFFRAVMFAVLYDRALTVPSVLGYLLLYMATQPSKSTISMRSSAFTRVVFATGMPVLIVILALSVLTVLARH